MAEREARREKLELGGVERGWGLWDPFSALGLLLHFSNTRPQPTLLPHLILGTST